MGRATISDVARKAAVSPTAVSFAFNRPGELSAATVSRILDAARELGYAPNPHARALLSKQCGVIGVLVPQEVSAVFGNPFFLSFVQGVGAVTDEAGLGVLLVPPLSGSLERALAAAPADGFLIVGLNEVHDEVAPLRRRGVPFVIVDGDAEHVPSVNVADAEGAYAAMAHLLARGHRDVLVLTFQEPLGHEPNYGVGGRRLVGYQRAYEERGRTLDLRALLGAEPSFEGGEQVFSEAWAAGRRPTAVVAVSDAMAIGVLSAARRLGIRVPDDLEVIGFDDISLAAYARPALSTVRQPIQEKGRVAAELLVRAMEGARPDDRVVLPTELVLRESTRR